MKKWDIICTVLDVIFGILSLLSIFGGFGDFGDYLTVFGFLFFGITHFLIKKYKL